MTYYIHLLYVRHSSHGSCTDSTVPANKDACVVHLSTYPCSRQCVCGCLSPFCLRGRQQTLAGNTDSQCGGTTHEKGGRRRGRPGYVA